MYKTPAPEDLLNVKGKEKGLNQIKKVKIIALSLLWEVGWFNNI